MQVQYDGTNYYGFAAQASDAEETIEKNIFNTLLKLRLIDDKKVYYYFKRILGYQFLI